MKHIFLFSTFTIAFLIATVASDFDSSGDLIINGQSLRHWLLKTDIKKSSREDVYQAETNIKLAGTNAIPFLINYLNASYGSSSSNAVFNVDTQAGAVLSGLASRSLQMFGTEVKDSIPRLVVLMNSDNPTTARSVANVLARLGPSGIHGIIVGLTNQNESVQLETIYVLNQLGTNIMPEVSCILGDLSKLNEEASNIAIDTIVNSGESYSKLIPEFIKKLNDTNSICRYASAMGLGKMGTNSVMAVPSLINLSNDSDNNVRAAAIWSLRNINR